MYKYLTEKLENTKGTHIVDITMIAFEVLNHSKSELIEDFGYLELKEICDVLDWDYTEKTQKILNDAFEMEETIDAIMYRNGRTGYLAKIHQEVPNLVNGHFMYSEGHCRIAYVYAHTIAELVDKAVEIGNEIDKNARKRALAKKEKGKKNKANKENANQKH